MGASVSALRKNLQGDEDEKNKISQRLEILERMVNQRLDKEMNAILNCERNDQEIDTGIIVSLHKMVFVKHDEQPRDDVEETIDKFFSRDYIGGIKSIIKIGADAILGNESVGEYELKDMFIVWSDDALIRCDTYYYRWNFAYKGVIENVEGVSGCLLVKRVIDLTKTDPQVLSWAITRMADRVNEANSKDENAKPVDPNELIKEALKILENVVSFQTKVKAMEIGGKANEN